MSDRHQNQSQPQSTFIACLALLLIAPLLAAPANAQDTLRNKSIRPPPTAVAPVPDTLGATHKPSLSEAEEGPPPFHPVTFSDYASSVAGPGVALSVMAGAGFSQVMHSPSAWSRSWAGYGKRVSAHAAEQGMRETLAFTMSAVFEQRRVDWAPCRCTGAGERLTRALALPFVVQKPSGFGLSPLAPISQLGGALLATSLYPGGFAIGKGLLNGLVGILSSAAGSAAREFLPSRLRNLGGRS